MPRNLMLNVITQSIVMLDVFTLILYDVVLRILMLGVFTQILSDFMLRILMLGVYTLILSDVKLSIVILSVIIYCVVLLSSVKLRVVTAECRGAFLQVKKPEDCWCRR